MSVVVILVAADDAATVTLVDAVLVVSFGTLSFF